MTDEVRARALLDALVRESSPTPRVAERGLAIVEARIVAHDEMPAPIAAVPRVAVVELVRAAGLALAIAAGVLLALRGAVVGVQVLRTAAVQHDAASDVVASPPVQRIEAAARPRGPIATPPEIAAMHEASAPPVVVPHVAADREATRAPIPDAAPDRGDDLAAEAALIRAAKSEPDDHAALVLLDRHAASFPDGTLAREREVLRVERTCALGRRDEARALAERFLADGKDDVLARRMRKVCAPR